MSEGVISGGREGVRTERREGRESLSQEFTFRCLCSLLRFPDTPISLKGEVARLKP